VWSQASMPMTRTMMSDERAAEAGYGPADTAIEFVEAAQVFTGGIWYREGTATWLFGHLRLDSNGVRGWLRMFGLVSPPLTLRWDEVTRVEPVLGPVPLLNKGVRISGAVDRPHLRMTLWTGTRARAEKVLRACEAHLPDRVERPERWRRVFTR
jgi:hypothetical protein